MRLLVVGAIAFGTCASSACTSHSSESEEALERFRRLLTESRSVRIKCSVTSIGPISGTSHYQLVTAEGNRIKVRNYGGSSELSGRGITCDGKNLRESILAAEGKEVTRSEQPCPPSLQRQVLSNLAVGGIGYAATTLAKLGEPAITCQEFYPIEREKRGEDNLLVINFLAQIAGESAQRISLWLNDKSGIPVRREVKMTVLGKEQILTESYSLVELDAHIDPIEFTLEKK